MRGSRRAFLAKFVTLAGVAVAGAAGAGAFLAGCASSGPRVYRYPPSGKIIDLFLGWYPELIRTGGAVELELTGTGRSILVVRTAIDRFMAVPPECGESLCRLELRENSFYCPCEKATYALDGTPMGDPSKPHLKSYRTEFRETTLRIFLG